MRGNAQPWVTLIGIFWKHTGISAKYRGSSSLWSLPGQAQLKWTQHRLGGFYPVCLLLNKQNEMLSYFDFIAGKLDWIDWRSCETSSSGNAVCNRTDLVQQIEQGLSVCFPWHKSFSDHVFVLFLFLIFFFVNLPTHILLHVCRVHLVCRGSRFLSERPCVAAKLVGTRVQY